MWAQKSCLQKIQLNDLTNIHRSRSKSDKWQKLVWIVKYKAHNSTTSSNCVVEMWYVVMITILTNNVHLVASVYGLC